jgi:hypothetical protein
MRYEELRALLVEQRLMVEDGAEAEHGELLR